MSGRADRADRGFLLLEALIGLAIVGMVAVALLSASGAQVRAADKASVLLVAGALAQDRLAAIQLLDRDALARPPDSLLGGVFPPPFDEYGWRAEVAAADEEYDLFAVRVEVAGRGEAFPLETLVHRPPLGLLAPPAAPGTGGGRGGGGGPGGGGGGPPAGRGGGPAAGAAGGGAS